ncbi:hypothetical protein C8J57DRAFT_1308657 [Mycena rebaudengoi]|nr:hypothetical protein C8J57DRAFT_1308657 [Mycena rebaudengoi]
MGVFDLTIGCLLIASWCNMILYTLELLQVYRYFSRFPTDPWFNKICVIATLLSDLVAVGACSAVTYLYSVSHWGDQQFLMTQPRVIAVSNVTAGLTAVIVQIWLTHMVFNLTKKWIWIPIISTFILLGGMAAVATTYEFLRNPSLGLSHLATYVTAWLCFQAAADLIIAGVLVVKLRALKTNFIGTKHLIRRMSLAAVRNGSITTILIIIGIILFRVEPQTNTATMIEMTIGRVYTLSMLVNLNSRRAEGATSQGSSSRKTTVASVHRKTAQEFNLSSLGVRRDVETHYQTDTIPLENPDYGFQKAHDIENQRHPNAAVFNL